MSITRPNWQEVLSTTDWKLLKEQKLTLLEVCGFSLFSDKTQKHLAGLVEFVDSVQDAAAEEIDEEVIFGKKCPECGSFMTNKGDDRNEMWECPELDCPINNE
jgi:hypothetical protein